MSNRFKAPRLPRGVTAADLISENPSAALIDWRKGNLRVLADFMEALPREKHDQSTFCGIGGQKSNGFCGTQTCALGWFISGGLSPHLGWTYFEKNYQQALKNARAMRETSKGELDLDDLAVIPVINNTAVIRNGEARNGMNYSYRYVAYVFFGQSAWGNVFSEAYLPKDEVVAELRRLADDAQDQFGQSELGVPHCYTEVYETPTVAALLVAKAPTTFAINYVNGDGSVKRFRSVETFRRSRAYTEEVSAWV